MVRQWFSISALLAVAAFLVASDAGQGRERRLFRRFRGQGDNIVMSTAQPESMMVRDGSSVADTPVTTTQTYGTPVRERRFGRRSSTYTETMVPQTPPTGARQAMYPPESTMGPSPVLLSVRLPADAELIVDGEKTTPTGSLRRFISPPINPDGKYYYEITAKWMENGKAKTQTRKVDVRAGQRLLVDLTQPLPEKTQR